MNLILAQASLDGAMSEGLGIIAKFLFIIAVIVIAHGGWQVRSGNADMGKMSIVGGLLLGLAVLIAEALFNAGGMPTIPISQMSKAIVQTHAGDDSDGKIWGIEGMNILFILAGLLLSVGLSLLLVRASRARVQRRSGRAALRARVRLRLRACGRASRNPTTPICWKPLSPASGWLAAARQPSHPLHT